MSMLAEFREFAVKTMPSILQSGHRRGLRQGVDSIVGDLIMPVVGAMIEQSGFSNLFFILGKNPNNPDCLGGPQEGRHPGLRLRQFLLTILVNFVLLAFIIFAMVKQINRLQPKEEGPPPRQPPPTQRTSFSCTKFKFLEEVSCA